MYPIVLNTLRELIRNRFFALVLFLAIILFGISLILNTLSLGELKRMLYDFGLSFIELSGLAIILFLGGGMIAREIEGRTIYLLLSKPVNRSVIYIGKYLGFSLAIGILVAFQSLVLFGILTFHSINIDPLLLPAIFGIFMKLLLLLSVILFFSNFVSPLIALFITIATYIIGHSGYVLLEYALQKGEAITVNVAHVILTIFPNLESLNFKNLVATSATIDSGSILGAFMGGSIYLAVMLMLGAILFSKKSFDNA